MRALVSFCLLTACSAPDHPRTLGGGGTAGAAASAFTPTTSTLVHVRRVSSLTALPRLGDPVENLAIVSDRDWAAFADHGVNIFARALPDGTGDMYLPLFEPTTWGLPDSSDVGTAVLQLVDARGNPIDGVYADDLPCGSGPYYDDGDDLVTHRATGNRGTIALFGVPPSHAVEVTLHKGADVFVAQVPIVGGTVTYVQTPIP